MLGENLSPKIWTKMPSANQIAVFLKKTKSPEQINEIAWYFACWYQFKKIGCDWQVSQSIWLQVF